MRDCDDRPPTRRFGLNGQIVDISGRPNEQGVYRALLTRDGVESEADDYMYLLIRQFTEVVKGEAESPLVPGEIGELNLRLQLDIAGGR